MASWRDNLAKIILDKLSKMSALILFGKQLEKADVYILLTLNQYSKGTETSPLGKESNMKDLSITLGMDYKTVFNSIKKLEETGKDFFTTGLIETYAKENDFRNVYVRITKTGISVMNQGFRLDDDEKEFQKNLIARIEKEHPELKKRDKK